MDTNTQKLALDRPIVLIGMMGAGKSSLGVRLAAQLHMDFYDSDREIEKSANMSIVEIFETHGEDAFRDGERRVITRLLKSGPQVLALGGGAFMAEETRALIKQKTVSIWLDVPLKELVKRVARRPHKRPLLDNTDIRARITQLMAERKPVYMHADIHLPISQRDHDSAVRLIVQELAAHQQHQTDDIQDNPQSWTK